MFNLVGIKSYRQFVSSESNTREYGRTEEECWAKIEKPVESVLYLDLGYSCDKNRYDDTIQLYHSHRLFWWASCFRINRSTVLDASLYLKCYHWSQVWLSGRSSNSLSVLQMYVY